MSSNKITVNKRAFRIFRSTIKYGDQFFIRDPETFKLYWTDPANIEKVVVNESDGKKIETYFVKQLAPNFEEMIATNPAALHSRPYGGGQGLNAAMSSVNSQANNYMTGAIDGIDQGLSLIHI